MGYRVLFLANPVKLSAKNEQLIVDNGEITRFPLEDIECIVCDTPQLNITARLLTKFAEYAITFYITDSGHHPSGVFYFIAVGAKKNSATAPGPTWEPVPGS